LKLYLGVVPGFYPWIQEELIQKFMLNSNVGIIFSFWHFKKYIHKIKAIGLHEFFSYNGPIIIDSGAYSAFNSGVKITLEEYSRFLTDLDLEESDIVVNLDVIGNLEKSLWNWCYLTDQFNFSILPVIHFPSTSNVYADTVHLGLGGMVPALKINEKGSVYDIAEWIAQLRVETNQEFHGFGLGSPFHQIAFNKQFKSMDWIGWRRNAAVGDCYTPEGSCSIPKVRKSKTRRKWLTEELFEKYHPPFIQELKKLQLPGKRGWEFRAIWNVWVFLNAHTYAKDIEKRPYVQAIRNRMILKRD
jgi:hypothetical protein